MRLLEWGLPDVLKSVHWPLASAKHVAKYGDLRYKFYIKHSPREAMSLLAMLPLGFAQPIRWPKTGIEVYDFSS